MDRNIPGVDANFVGSDHRNSSRKIVERLIRHGHERIAIVVGMPCTSMDDRLGGYREALCNAGLNEDDALVIRVNDNLVGSPLGAYEEDTLAKRLQAAGDFTCLYSLNTRLFSTGINALRAIGKRPGNDIAVACHDELPNPLARFSDGMPYAIEPTYAMGREATRILIERMQDSGIPNVQVTLESTIVEEPAWRKE
jgi:LacI family transcriptional regulator